MPKENLARKFQDFLQPAKAEARKVHDFSLQFASVKNALHEIGCRLDFSGMRERPSSGAPWITTITMRMPRERQVEVIDVLKRAGIDLPDQTGWLVAHYVVEDRLLGAGLITYEQIAEADKQAELVIFHGKGWRDEYTQRVSLK